MSIGSTHCSEAILSNTTRRTVMPVPLRAKDRVMRASRRSAHDPSSFLANSTALKPSGMIATSRPPAAKRRQAERKCRRAERPSFPRSALRANGGFIRARFGLWRDGSNSLISSPSCEKVGAPGNSSLRHALRRSSISLRISFAPTRCGQMARVPVPADGSSTISSGFMPAARAITHASRAGVENCWREIWSSCRLCCGGRACSRISKHLSVSAKSESSVIPECSRSHSSSASSMAQPDIFTDQPSVASLFPVSFWNMALMSFRVTWELVSRRRAIS